jgi:3-isopropylmalate/(R)-2-methylmalate dehydratase small subunit
MSESSRIERITGTALVVRGNDIDTDRILPARFLRAITFEGIEHHLFEDERSSMAARGERHPFDDSERRHARVLLVNANFGCGSSREHAPQAIRRYGIQAVVGESFAEIFFTNSITIGLPCVTAAPVDVERLMTIADASPDASFTVDLIARRVAVDSGRESQAPSVSVEIGLPETARNALVSGLWDATGLLLDRYEEVERFAADLPYVRGFGR